MTDSTRRALRTAYQTVIALITVFPVILSILTDAFPDAGVAAQVAVAAASVATVTKILNALEDAGIIPAWLKESSEEE